MSAEDQHEVINQRMDRLEASMSENTAITQGIKDDTADLLEVFRAVRGSLKVMGWLGNIAKWAAGLGAAVVGLYFTIRNGRPHP